jgi:hypothetical protein
MKKIIFREVQKFNAWWVWLILAGAFAASVLPLWYGLWSQLTTGEPWGNKPADDMTLGVITLFITLMMAGLLVLFFTMRLETEITQEEISFRFPPLVRKWRIIPRENILKVESGKYNPIRDYGGWGVRQGFGKKGRAYNVSGNMGLTLYLKDGKKVLIGTRRAQAIAASMDKMMNGKRVGMDPG